MENKSFTLTKENELKATKSELIFIYEHCEKQLIESLKSADEVLNRSTILVGVLFTIITSCIGYIVTNLKVGFHTPLFWSVILVAIYNVYLLYNIKDNILGTSYRTIGREAKNVFHDEYYNEYPDAELRENKIYIDCIDRYQSSIEYNNSINKIRWICFKAALTQIAYTPIVFLLTYLFLFFYSS